MSTAEKETYAAANAAYYDTPRADELDAVLTAAIERHDRLAAQAAQAPKCSECGSGMSLEVKWAGSKGERTVWSCPFCGHWR